MASPRPGAAVAAAGRRVGLHERLEEPADLVRRDADAGVGDGKLQSRGPAVVARGANGDADAALCGELHGVARQVHEDLAEARRVGVDRLGERVLIIDLEAQLLLAGPHLHHRQGIVDDLLERAVRLCQRQLLGLDPRQIENVADQFQQRLPVSLDSGEELALLFQRQVGSRQQVAEAENGRHRRADFVAHIGQELALGAAGCLGGELGPLQSFLTAEFRQGHGEMARQPLPQGNRRGRESPFAAVVQLQQPQPILAHVERYQGHRFVSRSRCSGFAYERAGRIRCWWPAAPSCSLSRSSPVP